jgi:hypothetical protein
LLPGRIPWPLIQEWCDREQLTEDQAVLLDACLVMMDGEFIKDQVERRQQESATK